MAFASTRASFALHLIVLHWLQPRFVLEIFIFETLKTPTGEGE
jgi:hypothetical protein